MGKTVAIYGQRITADTDWTRRRRRRRSWWRCINSENWLFTLPA